MTASRRASAIVTLGRHPILQRMDPPAVVVLPLGPHVAQVRHHLLGEQLGAVAGLPVRHVAVVHQAEHVPDPQRRDQVLHPVDHRLGAPGDDVAGLDQLTPGGVGEQLLHRRPELVERAGLDRVDRAVTRRVREPGVHVQAAVEEVEHVLAVEPLGLLVGLGDADDLGERSPVRRLVLVPRRDPIPVPVEQLLAGEVPAERQVRVVVVVVETEVPRLDRAAARDVHRRVRLLDRLGPAVDVAQLVVLAVERERLVLGPRPHDQLVGLGVLVAGQRRDLAVTEVGVHRRADGEPGDQPSAADAVEHRELFGHPDRRVVQRDRVADHTDRSAAGPAGQTGGDDVRARHDPVAVLVVLVDADAVEPELVGVLELVHVLVVHGVGPGRVEQLAVDVDPDRPVLLPEVVRQIRPRHQVEPGELHRNDPRSSCAGTSCQARPEQVGSGTTWSGG